MSAERFKHFLLVFDSVRGTEAEVRVFEATAPALDAYREAEQCFRGRPDVHVVLIGADSLETVKQTHSNYFGDSSIERLKAALRQASRHKAL